MIPCKILQEPDRTAEMILVQMGNEYMRDISVPDLPAPDQGGDRLAGIEQIIFPAADDQIRTVGLIPAAVARRKVISFMLSLSSKSNHADGRPAGQPTGYTQSNSSAPRTVKPARKAVFFAEKTACFGYASPLGVRHSRAMIG